MTKEELKRQQNMLRTLIEDIIYSRHAIKIEEITPTFKGLYVVYREDGEIQRLAKTIKYSELS